jgi:hypothetical protein
MEYAFAEVDVAERNSVEPVQVVDVVATAVVNCPRTCSDLPLERVKLDAAFNVVLFVEVELADIVQPPADESTSKLWKGEDPGFIVKPVVVAVSRTVPPFATNAPEETLRSRPTANVPEGSVAVPLWNVTAPVEVAFASKNAHAPPAPLKRILYALEPLNRTDCAFVAVSRSVPLLCVNAPPALTNEPATVSIVLAGAVTVPALINRWREVVAVALKVQPPPEPLKFKS